MHCTPRHVCTEWYLQVRVENHSYKTKVRETGTRRRVVRHEDVRLLNVKKRNRSRS
jgi:hypothetical protein